MTTRPHDVTDLYLAPIALHLDAELERMSAYSERELQLEVALATNREPTSAADRHATMLAALTHHQDPHGWDIQWCQRGLRLTHLGRSLVLGVPDSVRSYLQL